MGWPPYWLIFTGIPWLTDNPECGNLYLQSPRREQWGHQKTTAPMSLTFIPSKLLEYIICSHIKGHIDKFGALVLNNHGFRNFPSCDTQLALVLQDLFNHRDPQRSQIDLAVMDFVKAFDKVSLGRLMNTLMTYGIKEEVGNLTQTFLYERIQQVLVDGCKSDNSAVKWGVAQGMFIGSLLFFLYINDLPSVVDPDIFVILFVNGGLIYRPITCAEEDVVFLLFTDWHSNIKTIVLLN